jgi:hypothetical protein
MISVNNVAIKHEGTVLFISPSFSCLFTLTQLVPRFNVWSHTLVSKCHGTALSAQVEAAGNFTSIS